MPSPAASVASSTPDVGIVPKRLLRLHPLLAPHAAMNYDDGLLSTQERGDAAFQVVQGIAVLGKEGKFLGG
jgi:hypothetical protein